MFVSSSLASLLIIKLIIKSPQKGKKTKNTAVKWIEYGYTTGILCKQDDKGNSGEHAEQQTSSFKKSYL